MLCFAALATGTHTPGAVPSCLHDRSTPKHLCKKTKSVSTQREPLKPGKSLRLKQGVSCSISMACGVSGNHALPQNPATRIPKTRGFFEAGARPNRVARVGWVIERADLPTRGSDPKRGPL